VIPGWLTLHRDVTVCGPRDPDDVWDRYVRPRRWPEWSPQIRSVQYPAETLIPQTAGRIRGPAGLSARFRILDVTTDGPARSWSWSVASGGVHLHLAHAVESTAGGTRTRLSVRGPAPAVLLYLPFARLALHRLVR
jgi:hypothetical protein